MERDSDLNQDQWYSFCTCKLQAPSYKNKLLQEPSFGMIYSYVINNAILAMEVTLRGMLWEYEN
jgi:hypothetical protein